MASENKVQITLEAVNNTKAALDQVQSSFDSLLSKVKSSVKGFTDLYFAGKSIYDTGKFVGDFVKQFVDAAAESEQVEKRMAFQLETIGYQFQAIKPFVDDFAESIQSTTRFSGEIARQGLGQMMQYTPSVEKAMQGVKLAMDMTIQTGQDLGSTTRLVGNAMTGNVEILGRWIPELRDLDSKLGATATSANKAAYAIEILNKKFGGAAQKDIDSYAGKVEKFRNQWDSLKESAGEPIMELLGKSAEGWKMIFDLPQGKGAFESDEAIRERVRAMYAAWRNAVLQERAAQKSFEEEQARALQGAFGPEAINLLDQYQAKFFSMTGDRLKALDIEHNLEIRAIQVKFKEWSGAAELIKQVQAIQHKTRLEQIKKEKEAEVDLILSLATMWQGYYNDRISKENEVIALAKGGGVQTTVGARFEFRGIEDEVRKIAEQAGMFTKEELKKLEAIYIEKIKAVLPFQGGEWEEIPVATGRKITSTGPHTTWETDYRWREGSMSEEDRRIEDIREKATKLIQDIFKAAQQGAAYDTTTGTTGIINAFDESRNKVIALNQEIEKIRELKMEVDSSRIVDAIDKVKGLSSEIDKLADKVINIRVNINGEDIARNIEDQINARLGNGRSPLGRHFDR